jgi:RNase P subunit RPR2
MTMPALVCRACAEGEQLKIRTRADGVCEITCLMCGYQWERPPIDDPPEHQPTDDGSPSHAH